MKYHYYYYSETSLQRASHFVLCIEVVFSSEVQNGKVVIWYHDACPCSEIISIVSSYQRVPYRRVPCIMIISIVFFYQRVLYRRRVPCIMIISIVFSYQRDLYRRRFHCIMIIPCTRKLQRLALVSSEHNNL